MLSLLLILLRVSVGDGGSIDRRRVRDGDDETVIGAAHLRLSTDRNGIVGAKALAV